MRRLLFLLVLISISQVLFSGNVVRQTTANLNMRSRPNTKSEILRVIPKGTSVELLENCDCIWIPVLYDGEVGYIATKYLSKIYATPAQTRTSRTNNTQKSRQAPTKSYSKPSRNEKSAPAGATALCRDGTYSYSQNRRGTCSHHGGVARWL